MSTSSDLPESIVSPELHRILLTKVRSTTLGQLLEQVKTQFVPQLLSVALIAALSWQRASRLHLAMWVGTQLLIVHGLEAYLYFHARLLTREEHLKRGERLFRMVVFLNSAYF